MATQRSRGEPRRGSGASSAEREREEARFRRDPEAADTRYDPAADAPVDPRYDRADPRTTPPGMGAPPPTADPRAGWRDDVLTASGLNVLAGIWLIIAPFVLNYSNGDPYWNDIVFGAIVAVFALIRVGGAVRASWLSWINALIGIWLIVSAFWLDNTATAGWNDVILGAIVLVLAALSAGASEAAMEPRSRWRR